MIDNTLIKTRIDDKLTSEPLTLANIKDFAALHRAVFADYSASRLGVRAVEKMYLSLLESKTGFGCLIRSEGKPVGLVTGSFNYKVYYKYCLWKYGLFFLFRLFMTPSLFFSKAREIIHSVLANSRFEAKIGHPPLSACLITIGVEQGSQGSDVSKLLFADMKETFFKNGTKMFQVGTNIQNTQAIKYYKKMGCVESALTSNTIQFIYSFETNTTEGGEA